MDAPGTGHIACSPAVHIPCSTETTPSSCTLCGFMGSGKEVADHDCPLNPDDVPNRFDPYEALDTIADICESIESHFASDEQVHRLKLKLYALRAYITGMEK